MSRQRTGQCDTLTHLPTGQTSRSVFSADAWKPPHLACPGKVQGMRLDNLSGRRERRLSIVVVVRLSGREGAEEDEKTSSSRKARSRGSF